MANQFFNHGLTDFDFQQDTVLDVVDAVREQGDASNERLQTFQEQLAQISQDVSSMSSQVSIQSISWQTRFWYFQISEQQ